MLHGPYMSFVHELDKAMFHGSEKLDYSLVCYSYYKHIKENFKNQTLLVHGIKLVIETE